MKHRRIWMLVFLASSGCSQAQPPAPSLASVAGVYTLTVTRCAVSDEDTDPTVTFPPFDLSAIVPGTGSGTAWTFTQTGSDVAARTSGAVAPFDWSGNFAATVVSASVMRISTLTYRDGSSHGGLHNFSGIGQGRVDGSGVSGALVGDYAVTSTFGGFQGSTSSCHGAQMLFRFSRTQ